MKEKEFYEKIPEWISAPKETWTHVTYLAYFCHKYEKANGLKFRLVRGRKGPTMGKEAADFAKLFRLFAPEDYKTLPSDRKRELREEINWKIYNYINWIFEYKFRRGNRSVNGTRLFHVPSLMIEFERMYLAHKKKAERRQNIDFLLGWAKEHAPSVIDNYEIENQEDLKMLKKYIESYSLNENSEEFIFIKKAANMGLIKC